jgi:hypothetical protein
MNPQSIEYHTVNEIPDVGELMTAFFLSPSNFDSVNWYDEECYNETYNFDC